MTWTTPAYTELRLGFEITMYIANRWHRAAERTVLLGPPAVHGGLLFFRPPFRPQAGRLLAQSGQHVGL